MPIPNVGDRLTSNHGRGPLTAIIQRIDGEWVYFEVHKAGRFEISGRLRKAVFLEPAGCGWKPEEPKPVIGQPIRKDHLAPRIRNKGKLSPSRWFGPRVIPEVS